MITKTNIKQRLKEIYTEAKKISDRNKGLSPSKKSLDYPRWCELRNEEQGIKDQTIRVPFFG